MSINETIKQARKTALIVAAAGFLPLSGHAMLTHHDTENLDARFDPQENLSAGIDRDLGALAFRIGAHSDVTAEVTGTTATDAGSGAATSDAAAPGPESNELYNSLP